MNLPRASVYATVACIVGVLLVSGPLVGAVDLTREHTDSFAPGEGSLDASVESTPETVTLTKGKYGSGSYYLEAPAIPMELSNVTGQPMLVYRLEIGNLTYQRSTVHFVTSEQEGSYVLTLSRDALTPERVDADTYTGRLEVLVRTNDEERVLASDEVTVEVRR